MAKREQPQPKRNTKAKQKDAKTKAKLVATDPRFAELTSTEPDSES